MLSSIQIVLALAPHTDDVELGAGGTIARLIGEGATVHVAAFSTAEESLPPGAPSDMLEVECRKATGILGVPAENLICYHYPVRRLSYHRQEVLEELVALRRRLSPQLVLLPSQHDMHQDHQVLWAEGIRAFKNTQLLGYELPWNHLTFSPQAFMILERSHVERKWQALQNYESQMELGRPYFTQAFTEGLAKVRGAMVGAEWAEAFEVVRAKWDLSVPKGTRCV